MIEQLKALPPEQKARMRRVFRRDIGKVTRTLLKPLTTRQRAYMAGYLERIREFLGAVSE